MEKGVEVAAIGMGTPKLASEFIRNHNITFPIYIDLYRNSYELFEFPVKFGLGLRTIFKAKQSYEQGFRQGNIQGMAFQQGGEILFDNGEIAFKHIAKMAGEHKDLEELLDGL